MIRSKFAREKATSIISMFGISSPPVPLGKITGLLGFEIIPFDFPNTISALIKTEGTRKIIGVNSNYPKTRQRFSIAHELGHYLSGHENFDQDHQLVEGQRKYLDSQSRQEEEANEFAAELLMPESMLKKEVINSESEYGEIAKNYEVSEQALLIQLVNLKLLPGQNLD